MINGTTKEIEFLDPEDRKTVHFFRYVNRVPLNNANPGLLVNVLEYWQVGKAEKIPKFCWGYRSAITDENAYDLMRARRAR